MVLLLLLLACRALLWRRLVQQLQQQQLAALPLAVAAARGLAVGLAATVCRKSRRRS
jgi:hypothetical protein